MQREVIDSYEGAKLAPGRELFKMNMLIVFDRKDS